MCGNQPFHSRQALFQFPLMLMVSNVDDNNSEDYSKTSLRKDSTDRDTNERMNVCSNSIVGGSADDKSLDPHNNAIFERMSIKCHYSNVI